MVNDASVALGAPDRTPGPGSGERTPTSLRARATLRGASRIATALCLCLAAGAVRAGTYHVDPSKPGASPAGPGTPSQPFSSIASAVAARCSPGNIILVQPGTYREQVSIPSSGAPGAPFVLRAAGPGVIVDGSEDYSTLSKWVLNVGDAYLASSVNWAPKMVLVDGLPLAVTARPISSMPVNTFRYVSGQGLYVNLGGAHPGLQDTRVGKRNYAFAVSGKSWIVIEGFHTLRQDDRAIQVLSGAHDVEILGNTAQYASKYGIYVSGSTAVRIAGNTARDNFHHGIMLTEGASECTIEDNESFQNAVPNSRAANGLYLYGATNCVIRRNRWHDNQDSGQHLQSDANDNLSYNNLSWNNGDHGFDHLGATGTLHLNDLAYGNFKDGFSIEGGATGTRLFNCIAVDNGLTTSSSDLWVEYTSVAGFESNDNLFWNSTGDAPIRYNTGIYSTMEAYSAVSGQDTRSQQVDPLFVSPMTGNFHVYAGSPVIDRANTSHESFPLTDLEGHARADDPATPNVGFGRLDHADLGPLEYQPSGLPPVAVLVADPPSGLAPVSVNLDASNSFDPDGFIIEYYFDFGDGVSAGPQFGPVATHTYTAGTYQAVVTVTDNLGLSRSDTVTVVANRAPVAALSANPMHGRAPLTVMLDASASSDGEGALASYRFESSDGTVIGPQPSPTATHVFGTGTWTVRLTVTDEHGSADTLAAPIQVHVGPPNVPPTAALEVTPGGGSAPLAVTADASGSIDADGGIVSYRFTFDDTVVVGPQPGATANRVLDIGTHIVKVLVTDADGGTALAADTVVVTQPTDQAPMVSGPTSVTVSEAGTLTLTVTASDPDDEPLTSLTVNVASLPAGHDATFETAPDWSSGTLTWHPTTADSGNYTVTFTAANALSGSHTTTVIVRDLDTAPVIEAASSAEATEGSPFTLGVTASDPDGDAIDALTADFSGLPAGHSAVFTPGPGNRSGQLDWTPDYTDSGTYTVRFIAANALADTALLHLHVRGTDRAPDVVAPAAINATIGVALSVNVTALDADGDGIATLVADLSALPADHGAVFTPGAGNTTGSLSWAPTAAHSGTWSVRFVAANALADTAVTLITVPNPGQPPVAVLSASPLTGNAPLLVTLDGSGSSDAEGPIVSYRFEFGDGSVVGPQSSPVTTHVYAAGTWTARLTVTDQAGLVSHTTIELLVAALGPGPNLVTNPSFETGMSGWNPFAGSSTVRVNGGFSGNWAVQVTGGATGTSGFGINDSPNWIANSGNPGTRYRFTAWVRSATAAGQAKLQVREYLGSTKIGNTTTSVAVPLSPQWQLVIAEHVTQAPGTTLDLQVMDSPVVQGETFLVDNVAIHVVPNTGPALAQGSFAPAPDPGAELEFGVTLVPTVLRTHATLLLTTTRRGPVRIALFDASGRIVRHLLDEPDMAPGLHSVNFDAQDDRHGRLHPGVYFYRVQAIERSIAGKLVVVR